MAKSTDDTYYLEAAYAAAMGATPDQLTSLDAIDVAYANTDTRTYGVQITLKAV